MPSSSSFSDLSKANDEEKKLKKRKSETSKYFWRAKEEATIHYYAREACEKVVLRPVLAIK